MNCQDVTRYLNDAAEWSLSPGERKSFDTHLAGCARCRDQWEVQELLASIPVPVTPPRLHNRVSTVLELYAAGVLKPFRLRRAITVGGLLAIGVAAATAVYVKRDESVQSAFNADRTTVVVPDSPAPLPAADINSGSRDAGVGGDDNAEPGEDGRNTPAAGDARQRPESPVPADAATATGSDAGPARGEASDRAVAASVLVWLVDNQTEDERFATLATEYRGAVEQRLGEVDGLTVIDVSPVLEYVGSGVPKTEVARHLDADLLVLIRTYDVAGSSSRLEYRIIDVESGRELVSGGPNVAAWQRRSGREGILSGIVASVQRYAAALGARTSTETPRKAISAMSREELIDLVRDRNAADSDREAALRNLQNRLGPTPPGGETVDRLEVAAVATSIGMTATESASIRETAWRLVRDIDDRSLVESMLAALDSEPAAAVRYQIVAALSRFYDSRQVRQALERVASADPDNLVREAAALAPQQYETLVSAGQSR